MTGAEFRQKLLGMRATIDVLLKELATPDPSADKPAANRCPHPRERVDQTSGFGAGPKRFRCDACSETWEEA